LLDFPLDPPDGENVSGGGFGRFRSSVDKYHAGEDWWWGSGRGSSFGRPVYSIGHGLVTYAEPEGWNRDKGVIIIQHTFADGSTILSFYGHLDPPSVLLQSGQCVVRGEQIAQIGRPRSSPHLHFEIRTQSPYAPLTGYWPEDPATAGWLPPSEFIWNQRMTTSPGVRWSRPPAESATANEFSGRKGIGVVNGDTLVVLEGAALVGLALEDGRERWRYDEGSLITNAALDARPGAQEPLIYLSRRAGKLEAFSLLDEEGTVTFTSVWEIELDVGLGAPALIPFPQGGVVIVASQWLSYIGADGNVNWTQREAIVPFAWAATSNQLFLSTRSTTGVTHLWQIGASGAQPWEAAGTAVAEGYPVLAGERLWLYSRDGLYRLDVETQTATLHYPLSPGSPSLGDTAALPDGGLLLAHADRFDSRLIAFEAGGTLRWERSYRGLVDGQVQLAEIGGEIYVISEAGNGNDSTSNLSVFALDHNDGGLALIFSGGARSAILADTWMMTAGNQLLLNIGGGGHLLALDVQEAFRAVGEAATAR
jgi:murein DD-endopeptidase MepM/ murein hydrolase activator NlpD